MAEIHTLVIDRLGQHGDGIALTENGPVYVAGALAGETVVAAVSGDRGRLGSVELAAADRVVPFCPLFGRCGGCAVQHLAGPAAAAWKRELVVAALAHAGLETEVAATVPAHGLGRRRVVLHLRRGETGWEAGFMAARSHDLVPVPDCPLLVPGLREASTVALAIAGALGGAKPLDVQVTATDAGLDVDVRGHGPASPSRRTAMTTAAVRDDLARLSIHGDIIVERRPPLVSVDGGAVLPPPGGVLQATEAGAAALGELVRDAAAGARAVADLFAGVGPFALRLARTAPVHAVETDAAALAALDRAARGAADRRAIVVERRDLFRRPLLTSELARFDTVVFDPPRAGAEMQARQLAASTVARVIGVSCNPATFARDARILVDGGYRLVSVTPVDQFLHSAHVELVGVFEKPRPSRARRILG